MTEEMKKQLEEFERQERELVFDHFDHNVAWELGKALVEAAKEKNLPVVLDIRAYGNQLFRYAMPGTDGTNDMWIKRKYQMVDLKKMATLHIGAILESQGKDQEKNWYLPEKDYARFGGGFPLTVKNAGVIGSICCSGLPHTEDHAFLVKVLTEFLSK